MIGEKLTFAWVPGLSFGYLSYRQRRARVEKNSISEGAYKIEKSTYVVDEFPSFLRHMRKDLSPFFRREETGRPQVRGQSLKAKTKTHSAKALSTMGRNLLFALAKATTSSLYVAVADALFCVSGLMPRASAKRALRFAIWQSVEHLISACVLSDPREVTLLPQCTGCRMRPQGQLRVISASQGSVPGQPEGAWHGRVQGWLFGKLQDDTIALKSSSSSNCVGAHHDFRVLPHGAVHPPQASPWQSL